MYKKGDVVVFCGSGMFNIGVIESHYDDYDTFSYGIKAKKGIVFSVIEYDIIAKVEDESIKKKFLEFLSY